MAQATADSPRTSVRHPLAPLTGHGHAAAARLALGAAGPGTRLVYCALAEPAKRAVLAWDEQAAAPGGPLRPLRAAHAADLGDHSLARRGRTDQEGPGPGRPAATHGRGMDGEHRADQGRSGLPGRAGPPRYHRHVPGPGGGSRQPATSSWRSTPPGGAWRGGSRLPARRPGQQPVRAADREPGGPAGPRHRGGSGDRGRRGGARPRDGGRYDTASAGELRHLSALQIVQPDGPGFTVDDGCLTWGPWQMRASLHPVRDCVLRPDRLSRPRAPAAHHLPRHLSEMIVPYGSTAMNHWWKNASTPGMSAWQDGHPLEPAAKRRARSSTPTRGADETARPCARRGHSAARRLRRALDAPGRVNQALKSAVMAHGRVVDRDRRQNYLRLLLATSTWTA